MDKLSELFDVAKITIDDLNLFENNPEILRMEAIRRNSEFVTCPKCGVTGNRPNMMRWHFDNCNEMPLKKCLHCHKTIPRTVKPHIYKQKLYCNRKCYMASKIGLPFHTPTEKDKKNISKFNSKPVKVLDKKFKSIKEASNYYNVCYRTIHKWIKDGKNTDNKN